MLLPGSYVKYTHPEEHSADIIVETDNRRFISSIEKTILTGFVHDQIRAADTWDIRHSLNKYPSVSCVDSSGTIVIGEVIYVSKNQIRLEFSSEFSGRAYLS